MATEIKTSIRELTGALNRINSFIKVYNQIPNLSEVKIILKDLLNVSENTISIHMTKTVHSYIPFYITVEPF